MSDENPPLALRKRKNYLLWDKHESFEEQLRRYQRTTGDRESFVGFDRRFAAWCMEHPPLSREEIATT